MNNSIWYLLFVCTQFNVFKYYYLELIILFDINHSSDCIRVSNESVLLASLDDDYDDDDDDLPPNNVIWLL